MDADLQDSPEEIPGLVQMIEQDGYDLVSGWKQKRFDPKSRFINGFLDLLSISFIGKFGKRPMHFFGAIGILSTVIGMAILGYLAFCKLVMQASNIDDRPLFFLGILLVIVGVQLFIAGFLAELIIRNSQERNNYKVEDTIDVAS